MAKAKTQTKEVKDFALGSLKWAAGSRKKRKVVGRGTSSGHGKTCCRGTKGQKSRSGGVKRPGFEGGQTPLYRKLPKIGRFKNYPFRKVYSVINLSSLSGLDGAVSLKKLADIGLVRDGDRVKILGDGELKKALTVEAHAFSEGAKKKIEVAGGKAVQISFIKQGEKVA